MNLDVKVKKRRHDFDVDVSFSCKCGEILVLVGPSGAGKTTIVRLIAGLENPDEGRIAWGDEIWMDSDKRINQPTRKRRLGYVFQDYPLFPHLTLRANAAFSSQNGAEVDRLMKRFGIDHLREHKPDKVSGGERQRCAICQALARQPRALLLDEPFSALDVTTRRLLRDDIVELKDRLGIPMVYVTHDIGEALAIADVIVPIVSGKIDRSWLERPRNDQEREEQVLHPKAARKHRLSLVY
jgi:molybdate transport system ATP-binding protein